MQIRLIVPNVEWTGSPVQAYGPAIADIAGGFTATQAVGGWKDSNGNLVVEPVTVFDCDITQFVQARSDIEAQFRDLARRIGWELSQDCVYLSINGIGEFVKPEELAWRDGPQGQRELCNSEFIATLYHGYCQVALHVLGFHL